MTIWDHLVVRYFPLMEISNGYNYFSGYVSVKQQKNRRKEALANFCAY